MASYRLEGIVLRVHELGEADRLVTLYTPARGKCRLVAKGARRLRSRLAAGIQPLTHSRLLCWRGRSLDGISQVEVVDSFRPLRESLEALALATYACELVDALTAAEDANPRLYGLLLALLRTLADEAQARRRTGELAAGGERLLWAFQWKALALTGYRPALDGCAVCGDPAALAAAEVIVSLAEGGVVCPLHVGAGALLRVPVAVVGTIRGLLAAPLRAALNLRLSASEAGALAGLSRDFLNYVLERELHSEGFLELLRTQLRPAP
ncbi:MAG TPA: DNA repair protein RecO [Bacillota bacterium]